MTSSLWIAGYIIGGFIVAVLTLLLIRGRFGTPKEQGRFELTELARSEEIPASATRREIATCRGHDLEIRQMLGAGVLWLDGDTLGFVLRTPRRQVRIPLSAVISATPRSSFRRDAIEERSDETDLLVVEWETPDGRAIIGWQLPGATEWAAAVHTAVDGARG